jgi:predicted ArsR family transcriptional regulator
MAHGWERGKLAAASEWLPPEDRALMQAFLQDGKSADELAKLIGVTGRTVRRRVERLARRVSSPRFVFVGARLSQMTPMRRRIAEACILRGMSIRAAAARLKLSTHAVRLHLAAIHALCGHTPRRSPDNSWR